MCCRRFRLPACLLLLAALLVASGCRELIGPSEDPALPEPDSSLDSGADEGAQPTVPVPPRHGLFDAKKKNLVTPETVDF